MNSEIFQPIRKTINNIPLKVMLASTDEQIEQACRLRHEIFKVELGHGAGDMSISHEIDTDQYDEFCDHLIVVDEASEAIVGTYRLLPLDRVRNSVGLYSENEFNLRSLYQSSLPIAEVGRACIDAEYRDGSIINLLWYGLASYLQTFQYEYLCGCASLEKIATAETASKIYHYCQKNNLLTPDDLRAKPLEKNLVEGFSADLNVIDEKKLKRELPSLIRGYFSIGCRIAGEPAYDPDFDVIDFFIMFEHKSMAKRTQRFFK